jgi:spoIIIJ-associated protein
MPRGTQGAARGGRAAGTGPAREAREPREPRAPRAGGDGPARGPRPAAGGRSGGGRSGGRGLENAVPKLTEADFLKPPKFEEETGGGAPAPARRAPEAGDSGPSDAPRGDSRGDSRGRDRGPRDEGRARRPREEQPEIAPDINAEEVDFAASIVDDMLRMLEIPAELSIREPLTPGDGLGSVLAVIDISGDDLGLLIGRRGETLLSLQYLVNLIVSRRYPGRGGVSVDVEHYRHRREEQVMALAQRMADRVRETGSPITLEPMPAAERRLIHIALAEDPELETNSVGDGDNRKVVISARR